MTNIILHQLPDIDRYKDLPPEYNDYGRFGMLKGGGFYCTGLMSCHDPATLIGGYWACSRERNILCLSPRNTGFDTAFLEMINSVVHSGYIRVIARRAGIRLVHGIPRNAGESE